MYETEQNTERLILFCISESSVEGSGDEVEGLEELAMLAETAGAEVVGYITQSRPQPHPAHYFGKGKVDELKMYANAMGATGVLCDEELSSTQIKHLDKALGIKILDRTMIILDIFAERAISAEGKAQVELAQLRYRRSRLAGLGAQLSRQGGGTGGGLGIGARGPGEKKLETDRRHIQSRISQLNEELKEIRTGRAVLRERRLQTGVPVISLVGYTNAGKSTLMNALTSADVLVEDKLFATLDTTTRRMELPGGTGTLITDTVGFIDKLPHHLIQAFRATLEELEYATLLLHVVDASNPDHREQMSVVYETLKDLKCLDKPMITAFNKADVIEVVGSQGQEPGQNWTVNISAKTGYNLPQLLAVCEEILQSMRQKVTLLVPYSAGHVVSMIHKNCEIVSEAHIEEGTRIEAYVPAAIYGQVEGYVI